MFSLALILWLYAVGGVVAGRAAHADGSDRVTAIAAAACWPLAPSKWLFNFLRKQF